MLHVSEPVDGGVGRCVSAFAHDQVLRGWRVAVASPADVDPPLEEFLAAEVRAAGAQHVRWQARTPPGPATALEVVRLSRVIHRFRPDVVHLHSSAAGLAGRLAVRGSVATIFQPNGWSFLAADGVLRALALRWERFAAQRCSALVCVSSGERALGERAGIRAAYRVIPNGVDVSSATIERAEARNKLAVGDAPLVVCAGRLTRQKGQDVLLEAWSRVRSAVPDARLALVGDGPDRERLRDAASDDVHFVGAVRDTATWLAAADVVAIPSRWEGLSFTMLEAMATGRSIVSTDVPGARDALRPGAIIEPEDPPALAVALTQRLLDTDLRAREEAANRSTVETSFDIDAVCDEIAALYAELARA